MSRRDEILALARAPIAEAGDADTSMCAITESSGLRTAPRGIRATIVNGEVIVDDGRPTESRPGQVVRPR